MMGASERALDDAVHEAAAPVVAGHEALASHGAVDERDDAIVTVHPRVSDKAAGDTLMHVAEVT